MGLQGGESWSPGGAASAALAPASPRSPPDTSQLGRAGPGPGGALRAVPHPGREVAGGHLPPCALGEERPVPQGSRAATGQHRPRSPGSARPCACDLGCWVATLTQAPGGQVEPLSAPAVQGRLALGTHLVCKLCSSLKESLPGKVDQGTWRKPHRPHEGEGARGHRWRGPIHPP